MSDNEGISSDDEAAGRATIRVSVGEVNLIAILDKHCALNAIHKKILSRICEQVRCKKTFDDGVDIELDIIIDGRPVKTSFHVVGGLYADMILGKKFFVETQAHVYLELKLLEWSYKKTTITTNLLQNNYSRAASKAREKWEKTTDEAKEKLADVFESLGFTAPAPRKEDSDEEENEEKTATKTSKEKKNSSKNFAMSMTADDSECEVQPIGRAAIDVKIGNINVTAILDDTCVINAVHKKVFKRICLQDKDCVSYNEAENIELDFTIDGRPAVAVFRVLANLYADMTLGQEFFQSVKAHIHLELRLLKWSYQDELVITDMVEDDANFRALSGGSDAFDEYKSSEKETETGEPIAEPSGKKKKKKKKKNKKKKSKKTDRESEVHNYAPSTSSAAASISNDLQLLTLGGSKASTKGSKNDKFVKIFIAERELWDMLSGECLAYYAIYSSQKKISFVTGEVLERKEKTPLGFHMEAFHNAFGEAEEHEIKHLHLLSENEEAIRLMKEHQKKYEEDGDMEPE